ncbi:hypothetical protein CB1_000598009 [Camelus ferus]|nr:hypothetical protein CB1_000598009 [Camelus ferus]
MVSSICYTRGRYGTHVALKGKNVGLSVFLQSPVRNFSEGRTTPSTLVQPPSTSPVHCTFRDTGADSHVPATLGAQLLLGTAGLKTPHQQTTCVRGSLASPPPEVLPLQAETRTDRRHLALGQQLEGRGCEEGGGPEVCRHALEGGPRCAEPLELRGLQGLIAGERCRDSDAYPH